MERSTNFLVATIDKNFNMFTESENEIRFIEHIAEHVKRLSEISEEHHFYIDECAFAALGETNFPLRFTRVFAKDTQAVPKSRNYQVHDIRELPQIIASKDRYSPETQIFFIGSSQFLQKCVKFSRKLLLTVIDRDAPFTGEVIDTFPLDLMKHTFKKRRSLPVEMLDKIKQYRRLMEEKLPKTETIIAENGMKIVQPVEAPEIDPNDDLLNTPDYMFFEYSR